MAIRCTECGHIVTSHLKDRTGPKCTYCHQAQDGIDAIDKIDKSIINSLAWLHKALTLTAELGLAEEAEAIQFVGQQLCRAHMPLKQLKANANTIADMSDILNGIKQENIITADSGF